MSDDPVLVRHVSFTVGPRVETFFDLPLLTIIPLNSLAVDPVDISFTFDRTEPPPTSWRFDGWGGDQEKDSPR